MALIPYNHDASPTAAATVFVEAVAAEAAKGTLLDFQTGEQISERRWGQGAEPTELREPLSFMMKGKVVSKGVYGPAMKPLNESGAQFFRRMLGVPAHKDNTLVGMNLGRGPLYTWAANLMRAQIPNAAIFVPKSGWPMYADELEGFILIPYDQSAPAEEIAAFIERTCKERKVTPLGFLGNWPHNPTGVQQTNLAPIFEATDRINSDPEQIARRTRKFTDPIQRVTRIVSRKLSVFLDNAYYHVSPIRTLMLRGNDDHYLETGYETLDPKSVTPWVVGISGSKALGTAEPGLFFAVCSDNQIGAMRKEHLAVGFQQSGATDYFNNVSKALNKTNDPLWLNRFRERRATYAENKAAMDGAFAEAVVPGGVNLVGLYRFPAADLMGKRLVDIRGETIVTNRISDIVQAGGNAVGIVVVDNGFDEQGNAQLRVAFPSDPDEFAAGVPMYRRFIDHIKAAPRA